MPLPLCHTAIVLTTYELCPRDSAAFSGWKVAVFIAVLANLPDIDVVIGLLLQGNGNAFHRGPTHSILFALFTGCLASNAWRLWSQIPKISFRNCFLLILSHVIADAFFTSSPVSFLWPLEVNWVACYRGWGNVMSLVFLRPFQDAKIIVGCTVVIILSQSIRRCF